MKVSNSRYALFCSLTVRSRGKEAKLGKKNKYVSVSHHFLLVALCNRLLLGVSCSCHQNCCWIKTLELIFWSAGGKEAAAVLKPAAPVPLSPLRPVSFEADFSLWNKCLHGCSVGALLCREKEMGREERTANWINDQSRKKSKLNLKRNNTNIKSNMSNLKWNQGYELLNQQWKSTHH